MTRSAHVVVIDADRCKGCGLCVDFCPAGALRVGDSLNTAGYHPAEATEDGECTGCQACVAICPDACIELYRRRGPSQATGGEGAASRELKTAAAD